MDDQEFSSLFGNLHDYSNSELIKNEENESLLNLLKTLTNHLKQAHNRLSISEAALRDICTILCKSSSQLDNTRSMLLVTELFRCLRNACGGCPKNQDVMNRCGTVFEDTASFLVLMMPKLNGCEQSLVCVRCGMQFLGNAVTGSENNAAIVWQLLSAKFSDFLSCDDANLAAYSCMLLHGCLDRVRGEALLASSLGHSLVSAVLQLLMKRDVDWGLFTLEKLLGCENFLVSVHKDLSVAERTLVLVLMFTMLEKTAPSAEQDCPVACQNVLSLVEEFIKEAHIILRTSNGGVDSPDTSDVDPSNVLKILDILCAASFHPSLQLEIQKKEELLKCTINLLHCLHMIGQEGDNAFTVVQKISAQSDVDQSHPAYGLKKDLIRLVGNMCHRHRRNQDMVREMGGIGLILDHTAIDGRNPYITQWSVYAVHNLCEDNLDNQAVIAGMNVEGVTNNADLRQQFGISAEVQGSKVVINKTAEK